MYKNLLYIFLTASILMQASCSINTEPKGPEKQHDESANLTTAILTDEQMTTIGIELGKLEKKQLTASMKANGILKVPNQNKATATPLMGGVIRSISVSAGNVVSKDQTIATISNTSFITMQEDFLATAAKLSLAETEFRRQQDLNKGNATALKTLQAAETDYKSLNAKRSSLQKQLELIGINTEDLTPDKIQSTIRITSPISGTVSNVMATIGSYIDANNPLAEVIDNSQLHLDLFVYEKDLLKIKEGQMIHFTLTNNPGKEYDAKIFAISNTFESNSKAIAVHATVEGNKQGLIDGMSITAVVSLENAMLDAVPSDAVVNYQGTDYIFIVSKTQGENPSHEDKSVSTVKTDKSKNSSAKTIEKNIPSQETVFEIIPVKRGTSDVGFTEITFLKDIPKDAKIVTKGAFFILAKMTNAGEHED